MGALIDLADPKYDEIVKKAWGRLYPMIINRRVKHATDNLRYVNRDGKAILQQQVLATVQFERPVIKWMTTIIVDDEYLWVDVPMVEED